LGTVGAINHHINPKSGGSVALGPISAKCAFGMNMFKDLFAGVRNVVGGRLSHPFAPSKIHAPVWEHRLAATVQFLLYASLLAMPLLGWAASDTAGDTVHVFGIVTLPSLLTMDEDRSNLLFNIHGWVATGLLTCAALHVLGALRHRFVLRDKVLEPML
jgi:cytochrome b561